MVIRLIRVDDGLAKESAAALMNFPVRLYDRPRSSRAHVSSSSSSDSYTPEPSSRTTGQTQYPAGPTGMESEGAEDECTG